MESADVKDEVKIEVVADEVSSIKPEEDSSIPADPGQEEGKKKIDPRSTYPPEGSRRWKDIYRAAKEGEKIKAEFEEYKKAHANTEAILKEMRDQNRRLVKALEKFTGSVVAGKEDSDDEGNRLKEMQDKLTHLKNERKNARERADFDKVDYLDDQIFDLRTAIKDLETEQKAKKSEKKSASEVDEDEEAAYEAFIERNSEWLKDAVMAGAAASYEKKLRRDPVWRDKPTHEILEEVESHILERFGYKNKGGDNKVGKSESNRGRWVTNSVEEGSYRVSSGSKHPGTVKMSAAEVELARGFGVDLQEWAKEKSRDKEVDKNG